MLMFQIQRQRRNDISTEDYVEYADTRGPRKTHGTSINTILTLIYKKSWCIINMFPLGLCFSFFFLKNCKYGKRKSIEYFLNDRNESGGEGGGHRGKKTHSRFTKHLELIYTEKKNKTNAIFAFCFEEGGN